MPDSPAPSRLSDVPTLRVANHAVVTGRRSDASLYDYALATYDTGDVFDQSLSKGFVELWGLPSKVAALRDRRVAGE